MKYVRALNPDEVQALRECHKSGATHRERQRAHALLLSARGFGLEQLADIFECDRDTVSGWIDHFDQQGLTGLADAPKSGRRPSLEAGVRQEIVQTVHQRPQANLKAVLL